jgi:hypothetical protein
MVIKRKSLKSKSKSKTKKDSSSYKLVSKKKSKMVKKVKNGKNSKNRNNRTISKKISSKKRYTGRRKYFTNGKKRTLKVLKGGDACEYVKVEGIKLPQLEIPDQLAKLTNDCNSVTTPTGGPSVQHPNIGN